MHDGLTLNRNEAVLRHAREAAPVGDSYRRLSVSEKNKLIAFLSSL